MPRLLSLSIVLILCVSAQSNLNISQQAWLYRIVQKTPVLKRNLDHCFLFNQEPFIQNSLNGGVIDYNAIEYYLQYHPDSLQIDWEALSTSSPGLIAEASTLLAIYELNEQLKTIIQDEAINDSLYLSFKKALKGSLPQKLKSKKETPLLFTVMHPSLPLKIKLQQLDDLKLEAKEQEKIMNQWRLTLNKTITSRSQSFFQQLAPEQDYRHLLLLAAGEGSGTAGLLYESEPHPDGSNRYWYGKAIGLFSYEVNAHNDKVGPREMRNGEIRLNDDSPNSFHFSLWGLNSSFKPLVVITANNKSYHLFSDYASKELSPDPSKGSGLSYIDRIQQTREDLIDRPLKELNQESSLGNILDKEYQTKALIEGKLETLGLEIDSLQKVDPLPEAAINYRRTLIDTHLSNLTKKEERIKSLEQKLATEYRQLDNARNKVEKMEALLGPNPQTWKEDAGVYTFADGVWFNEVTQDLVFPETMKPSALSIDLLSASYSLQGEQRDEVQLLVNNTTPPLWQEATEPNKVTDTFKIIHYFYPDEFIVHSIDIPVQEWDSIKHLEVYLKSKSIRLRADNPNQYSDLQREHVLPITDLGKQRYSQAQIIITNDTTKIVIESSTDPVPTKLSQLPDEIRQQLNVRESAVSHNQYLATLRGLALIHALHPDVSIDQLKIQYPMPEQHIKLLWKFISEH